MHSDNPYEYPFKQMCEYYLSLMDGDTHMVENAYALMREKGIVDEHGFPIYEEEEEVRPVIKTKLVKELNKVIKN